MSIWNGRVKSSWQTLFICLFHQQNFTEMKPWSKQCTQARNTKSNKTIIALYFQKPVAQGGDWHVAWWSQLGVTGRECGDITHKGAGRTKQKMHQFTWDFKLGATFLEVVPAWIWRMHQRLPHWMSSGCEKTLRQPSPVPEATAPDANMFIWVLALLKEVKILTESSPYKRWGKASRTWRVQRPVFSLEILQGPFGFLHLQSERLQVFFCFASWSCPWQSDSKQYSVAKGSLRNMP